MPQTTIPLAGAYTQRPGIFLSSSVERDQRFINTLFDVVSDKFTQSANVYCVKRPGLLLYSTPAAGTFGSAVHRVSGGPAIVVSAFGATNSTIFYGTTDCGTITGVTYFITEGYLSNELFYFITSTDNTGWYLADNAATDATPTFTANTNTSAILTNVSSITNVYVGQALSGVDIAAGSRVQSIDSATQITMTLAATGTTVGVTVTFTRVAKILSANFPTSNSGQFVAIDGYVCIADDTNRRVYNSDLNSIANWSTSSYFPFNQEADNPVSCAKHNNKLMVLGRNSYSFYENVGNSIGSPFSVIKELTSRIGCYHTALKPLAQVGDSIYWFGAGQGYSRAAWSLSNFKAEKISNSAVDRQLNNLLTVSLVSAFTVDGVEYMMISSDQTPRQTYLISRQNQVCEAYFPASGTLVASGGLSTTATADSQGVYCINLNSGLPEGEIYKLDSTTFRDDSTAFTMTIQTEPKALNGGKGFTVNAVTLLADNQSSGTTTLSTSADGTITYVSKGSFTMTSNQKVVRRCGHYKDSCSFKLEHSANTAWRGQAIVVDWEPAVT